MKAHFDTIVLGLGGMGSAAAYHLARRGQCVLGLEQYTPAHNRGSSHGQSRIIRQAYFEDPAYVPLVLRAYELWRQLERDSRRDLLRITGALMMGSPESAIITGSRRSAQEHNLPHEMLDASEIRRRFPQFRPSPETVALYEQEAGILHPEATVAVHLDLAARHGAVLHFEEPVARWEITASGEAVRVTTGQGTYEVGRLVITSGPWAPVALADLRLPLVVERQVQFWFAPAAGVGPFLPGRFPIYIWDAGDAPSAYGFPAIEGASGGVKVAVHHGGAICTPETIDREVHPHEIDRMRAFLRQRIPDLDGPCIKAATCMYTNTPDEHFVVGQHPAHPRVAIAAGFSGHGYKFASVMGEILADLTIDGATRHPIALFDPRRFQSGAGGA